MGMNRILLLILALFAYLFAPASSIACGRYVLALHTVDPTHPVDPCVDEMVTAKTAVSTIFDFNLTVHLPIADIAFVIASTLTSLLYICFSAPYLLQVVPPTPPPRFKAI